MRWFSSPKFMDMDDYLKSLGHRYEIYGDLLGYYLIKLGDLPYDMAAPLIKVGLFYLDLDRVREGMLKAYVDLAVLQSGFMPLPSYVQKYSEPALVKEARQQIDDSVRGMYSGSKESVGILEEYVNIKDPTEWMRILVLCEDDIIFPGKAVLLPGEKGYYDLEKLVAMLDEPIYVDDYEELGIHCERLTRLVVVDPLLYTNAKSALDTLRKDLKEKMGRDMLFHASEFLEYLAIDAKSFSSEWENIRSRAIEYLKGNYRFLVVHDEIWRVNKAKEDLEIASANMIRNEYKECMSRIGEACESLLAVMYHISKKEPAGKRCFDDLATSLRGDIVNGYGQDVYEDLEYIKKMRNLVSHPQPSVITFEDVLKAMKKAETFQALFLRKMKKELSV